MPKIISNTERQLTRNLIFETGIALVRKKGLKHVTVDDVVNAVGIGKGSFYSYYSSKEELLFDLVKKAEKNMFDTILKVLDSEMALRDKIEEILYKVYLSSDSLIFYVSSTDIDYLMRKLPDRYVEFERLKSEGNFEKVAELIHLEVSPLNYGTISYLMEGLRNIATNTAQYGENARKQSLKIIVDAIADYLSTEVEKK